MNGPLLTAETLDRLESLDLACRKSRYGRFKGERRSRRKGRSVEFADFRSYVQGDDLRFVDWSSFARLDRLFVKLFFEEEDLYFHGLLDASASMEFGEPTKLRVAKQLLAALGYIGLIRSHRVRIETVGSDARSVGPVWRGRFQASRMFNYVENLAEIPGSSLNEGLRSFAARDAGRGVAVLVSDLMDKNGYQQALRHLAGRANDVYVVHVLSREELKPELTGDLRLVDCEDEQATEVTVEQSLLEAYDRTLQAFLAEARTFCTRRDLNYLFIDNQTPVERIVAETLGRQGPVRR